MEHILAASERILHNAGVPALGIAFLLTELRAGTPGVHTLDAPSLRVLLETAPTRFRVLDPWRGPWRTMVRATGGEGDAWVVAVRDPGDAGATPGHPILRRLHHTVRWLALNLDPLSTRSVVRWSSMAMATAPAPVIPNLREEPAGVGLRSG